MYTYNTYIHTYTDNFPYSLEWTLSSPQSPRHVLRCSSRTNHNNDNNNKD